jgi:predicted phosphodiesterase
MPRTLVIGDVHGCADELGRLLAKVRPTRVVLLGDLFTKGPDPVGVWKLIRRYDAESVLGNHDAEVLQRWKPGRELPRKAFRWLQRCPLSIEGPGWVAVHAGVHPRHGPRRLSREHALYLREVEGRPWWKRYRGKQLVLHGHDARTGLNDRRPHTLGLDTGCVKGGRLTGYLLEKERVVSVRSRQ